MSRPADDGGGGGSQSIDLYPDDLNAVAGKFATGQNDLDTAASALNAALQSAAGMAGNDDYGHNFARKYDPAAKALFHTLSAGIRAIGQASEALVTTANNYLKADHHSNAAKGKGAPKLYPWPLVVTDIMYPDPASAVGPGHSSVPSVIAKYWPNGHQDKLRDAATAYRTASTAIQGIGRSLHGQVQSLTDNNSDDSVRAMAGFWAKIWQDGGNTGKAPLSAAHDACDKLASACDKFAHAIDEAHSSTEEKLAGAGIAVGLTTAVGVLLTVVTAGASDAGAAALDGAEAGAILGGVEATAEAAIAEIDTAVIADVGTELEAAAEAVPEIEAVDAETTEVDEALDRELTETETREPAEGGADGDTTQPSNEPDPDAKPSGRRTSTSPKDDAETLRALGRENESADILSREGYDVEQNPDVPGAKNPDYRVEGEVFDNYAPSGSNARNIAREMAKKVEKGQTDRIVLNLKDSAVDMAKMRSQLQDWPIDGLKEVLVIDGDGNVVNFYP
ncbi:WXG100-like domain-containing protein [Streptomyces sp. NBC_01497]|uniref:CdiA C-terminal domain-containing protein n=1 Tax=Streptomyces sp. NBC_01497 TaxID=2903885 RepID=UPI002E31E9E9|nr:hypothetical protein [Streptomyces sp. NBC_01497]